ncbi:uncharacterized protein LTR77_007816 [Saxophila tyrrhenica]|uniref:Uncharacterized protein n=1 Tax=Saxophila tyrrhenica TaxID=1690608 RepID=A0AAV9P3L7_9PEZI|nr:hypothetical protein LTR77_007816 [Saxophila tyrrhenica]
MPKVQLAAVSSLWPNAEWRSEYDEPSSDIVSSEIWPSLRELSLSRVTDEVLRSDPAEASWVQHAEQLPDFLPALRTKIYENPSMVPVVHRKSILTEAFALCDKVDLSPFKDLRWIPVLGEAFICLTVTQALSTTDNRIVPIPADSYIGWKNYFSSSMNTAPYIRTTASGAWILYVFHETVGNAGTSATPEDVRSAFVTTADDGTVLAASADDFFGAVGSSPSPEQGRILAAEYKQNLTKFRAWQGIDRSVGYRGIWAKVDVSSASQEEAEEAVMLAKKYNSEIRRDIKRFSDEAIAEWLTPDAL